MPGNEQNVTLLSHTAVSENSKASSPTPAPRTSTPKQDGKNTNPFEEAEDATSNKPSPILPTNQVSQLGETPFLFRQNIKLYEMRIHLVLIL